MTLQLGLSALMSLPWLGWPLPAEGRRRPQAESIFSGSAEHRLAKAQRLLRAPRSREDVLWGRRLLNFDAWRGHGASQVALGVWLSRPGQPLADRLEGARWLVRAARTGRPGAARSWSEAVKRMSPLAQRLARAQAASLRGATRQPATPPRPGQLPVRAPDLEALAGSGEPWAQTALGHQLSRTGAPEEAATWWFRAAARGDRLACANLAGAFERGDGVPRASLVAFGYWCAARALAPAEALARYPARATLPPDAVVRVQPWLSAWQAHVEAGATGSDGPP
ncbi:MAG: hypothetical protein VKQ33_13465 [Candidatus Sericytochromatia bacterium]|nr:hypothetical protein [Candidatus Sericytochromatia bacterium]